MAHDGTVASRMRMESSRTSMRYSRWCMWSSHRWQVVESVESMLASAQHGGLWAIITEVMNGYKLCFLTPLQHLVTAL